MFVITSDINSMPPPEVSPKPFIRDIPIAFDFMSPSLLQKKILLKKIT